MDQNLQKIIQTHSLTHNQMFNKLKYTFSKHLHLQLNSYQEEQQNIRTKPPKGTRDFHPKQMAIRNYVFKIITSIFQKHGAVEIDTPIFELKQVLMGKYGQESKLIYDLEDQGEGQSLSLRYDLTVPFARYMGSYNLQKIKRYHIGKVYRRDKPYISKGRFRQFYQCDFDIAGTYHPMVPDAQVLKVFYQIMNELNIGNFVIRINSRKILDAMIQLSGAPIQKFKSICSTIDKLDKLSWQQVREELINVRKLKQESADKLWQYTKLKGQPFQILTTLKEKKLLDCKIGNQAIQQIQLLINYLQQMNCLSKINFDLSLARGLDYYTGLIFEACLVGQNQYADLGSISGGGRYNGLIGMFSKNEIPAVGGSIGLQRIFSILEKKLQNKIRSNQTQVFVASIGKQMMKHKLNLVNFLWQNNIKAQILYQDNVKPQKQIDHCFEFSIPLIIWLGENEVKSGLIKLKNLVKRQQFIVKRGQLISKIKEQVSDFQNKLFKGQIKFEAPSLTKKKQ